MDTARKEPASGVPLRVALRRRLGMVAMDSFWQGLAAAARYLPSIRAELAEIEVLRDIPYQDTGRVEHLLDVYRPHEPPPPWPMVVYVHGGGFRILSKDSLWVMPAAFARRGYIVFNINYRLAPRHLFPAAIADACAALTWVHRHGSSYGGDPSRLVLAGESAGGNLAAALAITTSYARPEPWARAVWDAGIRPGAVVPACAVLQVSDMQRYLRESRPSTFVADRLLEVEQAYLGDRPRSLDELDLADPLRVLERGEPPERPLPPFFAGVGTRDPLQADTVRLRAALARLGVECEDRYYPGEIHAFQAMLFRPAARLYWQHCFDFLARHGL